MSPALTPRHGSISKKVVRVFVLLMAVGIIAAAIWTTSAAVVENMHFAQGTNQILQLVATAHTVADRDKNFATQPNEDLISDMTRVGLISGLIEQKPAILFNPWKGTVQSTSPMPAAMRIETDVPGHDCRRLALFFIKNGGDLGLKIVEARSGEEQIWQRFYSPAEGISLSGSTAVEDACERADRVRLALVFTVR